jgi:hypothetical protein
MAVEIRNASAISLNQSQKVTLSFPSVLVATLHYRTDSLVTLRRSRMVSKNKIELVVRPVTLYSALGPPATALRADKAGP